MALFAASQLRTSSIKILGECFDILGKLQNT
jgi:hypothetical protein